MARPGLGLGASKPYVLRPDSHESENIEWEAELIARKLLTISTAAAMALAPTVAYGASATTAPARAGASTSNASGLQGGHSAELTLGFLVLLAILMVVLGGDDEGPNNPTSP
jgi:hypothetical protein